MTGLYSGCHIAFWTCRTGPFRSTRARSSRTACSATATATAAETSQVIHLGKQGCTRSGHVDQAAHGLLRSLPQGEESAFLALAQELRGAQGAERFNLLFERLAEQVKTMIEETAGRPGAGPMEPWIAAWERLTSLPEEVEAVNLDRQDAFWSAVGALRQAARS